MKEKQLRRDVPATLVAAFIEHYIESNYELDEDSKETSGTSQFAWEVDLPERTIYRIRHGESANVSFELLDQMLSKLDREYLWHWTAEEGGFAEWYADIPAPPAEPTVEQLRQREVDNAKRHARREGRDWLEVLMERARGQMELQCA